MSRKSRKTEYNGSPDTVKIEYTKKKRPLIGRIPGKIKAEILKQVQTGRNKVEVAGQYGINPKTITRWQERLAEEKANLENPQPEQADEAKLLEPRSTRPRTSPGKLEKSIEDQIISLKREYPQMGSAQIRNQLKRFKNIWVSVRAINRVLREAGFELQKHGASHEKDKPGKIQTCRPGELWMMDILSLRIHKEKGYLFCILDHYSRYITGWGLYTDAGADRAVEAVKRAVTTHGKPERIHTDRGTQFYSWKGQTDFEKYLQSLEIDHSISRPHRPETCGAVEAVNKTVRRELLDVREFENLEAAREGLREFFKYYNSQRTHMGIGEITPQDKLLGTLDAVKEKARKIIQQNTLAANPVTAAEAESAGSVPVFGLAMRGENLEITFCGKKYILESA